VNPSFDMSMPLRDAHGALEELLHDPDSLARLSACVDALCSCLRSGGKVLAIGNGGSMCDAAHFCEELSGRFRADRTPLAAIACSDPGHLTCVANDYGFEHVFSRWIEAIGMPCDCVVILSTSGNSPNCVRAARAATARGAKTIALLGKGGGELRGMTEHAVVVPGRTSDRIQELHMLILHAFVEGIEHGLKLSRPA
jgi:D-sedoheptulose 7-phosphate isomerase